MMQLESCESSSSSLLQSTKGFWGGTNQKGILDMKLTFWWEDSVKRPGEKLGEKVVTGKAISKYCIVLI